MAGQWNKKKQAKEKSAYGMWIKSTHYQECVEKLQMLYFSSLRL